MISHSYYKTLVMTFCIENTSNRNNNSMNYNRSDRLLRRNRPITWLYNLLQQVFKVLKLAFGIKTQFYNFFLIFFIIFLYILNFVFNIFIYILISFVLFLYFNDFF
jgi:hypothetical protein